MKDTQSSLPSNDLLGGDVVHQLVVLMDEQPDGLEKVLNHIETANPKLYNDLKDFVARHSDLIEPSSLPHSNNSS